MKRRAVLSGLAALPFARVRPDAPPCTAARFTAALPGRLGGARRSRRRPGDPGGAFGVCQLRPATKGGPIDQAPSGALDSLLNWTRHISPVTIKESFVPVGRAGEPPQPAADIGARAVRQDAPHAGTTAAGRHALGGGPYASQGACFQAEWQRSIPGAHHPPLLAVNVNDDAAGLFFVHHGVSSGQRSAAGLSLKRLDCTPRTRGERR